jgi:hypothetical protein
MSESDDNPITSVLLPSARVTLFTHDAETRARRLNRWPSDWRFARVDDECCPKATSTPRSSTYTKPMASPDLVIIQTEEISRQPSPTVLEALGGVSAVERHGGDHRIGPVNDVNLYQPPGQHGHQRLSRQAAENRTAERTTSPPTLLKKIGATGSRLIAADGSQGRCRCVSLAAQALAWAILRRTLGSQDLPAGCVGRLVDDECRPGVRAIDDAGGRLAKRGRRKPQRRFSLTRMVHNASDKLFVLSDGR